MMFEILTKLDMGAPQIVALLILAQRGIEELYSMRNTKKLLEQGAIEVGQKFYPVVATTHLGWIAAIFLLIPSNAVVIWPLVWLYVLVQFIRYWVIGILGQY